MARLQLALNVPDLEAAIRFYSTLLGTPPAKRKPGYANFAVDDPALKLVLFEAPGSESRLNHLGIEVGSTAEVSAASARLAAAGLAPEAEHGTCCYALQDKVWVDAPDGPWEVYTVLADSDVRDDRAAAGTDPGADTVCCGGAVSEDPAAAADPVCCA